MVSNWKMSTEGNSKDGELWFMSSSYSNPGDQVDTAANINIIPGADGDNDSWVTWAFNIGGQLPRSSKDVSGAFNWAVEESSSVRIRIRIDNRTVSLGGNSLISRPDGPFTRPVRSSDGTVSVISLPGLPRCICSMFSMTMPDSHRSANRKPARGPY